MFGWNGAQFDGISDRCVVPVTLGQDSSRWTNLFDVGELFDRAFGLEVNFDDFDGIVLDFDGHPGELTFSETVGFLEGNERVSLVIIVRPTSLDEFAVEVLFHVVVRPDQLGKAGSVPHPVEPRILSMHGSTSSPSVFEMNGT